MCIIKNLCLKGIMIEYDGNYLEEYKIYRTSEFISLLII